MTRETNTTNRTPSILSTALRLGRVSNLPTVWTNVLVGFALNGGGFSPVAYVCVGLAASLFYVAGMFLNDAFDRHWDAQHRPDRPIPAGEVDADTVFVAGFGLMATGLAVLGVGLGARVPALVGLALCGLIVLYNANHKGNPLSPVIMGLCRVCLYLLGATAAAIVPGPAVWVAAAVLLAYLVGLTALAKRETVIPGVGPIIGLLIAGICLLDAAVLALCGHFLAAVLAASGYFVTRGLHRQVAGT